MLAIAGIFVVLGAVVGGFLLEGGNLSVLIQPVELLIIGGAALGSFLIASPMKTAIMVSKNVFAVFKPKEASKQSFINVLSLIFELLTIARREGFLGIESDIEQPAKSKVFTKYPSVLGEHEVVAFICDNFKSLMTGNVDSHEFENLMEVDIEVQHAQEMIPPGSVGKVADSLPGLGIVAAVMGVVLTMGKINEPPEVLGHSIGAALVGTFLGVLACYGFVGPMAANLEHQAREKQSQLNVIKVALAAYAFGMPPVLSVESGRRAIPTVDRPSFEELEKAMKKGRAEKAG